MYTPDEKIVEFMRRYLGIDGLAQFREFMEEYKTVSPCFTPKGSSIPHPVHFREGMQIRNAMRNSRLCDGWTAHDFDNRWAIIVTEAIRETEG